MAFIQQPPLLDNQYLEDRLLRSLLRRVLPQPMLHEIERLDLEPLDVVRARYLSELMDARALADHARVAGLIATAEDAESKGTR